MKRYLLLVLAICLVLLGCDPTVDPSTGGGKDSFDSTPSIMDADAYKKYLAGGVWRGESDSWVYEFKFEYLNELESIMDYKAKKIYDDNVYHKNRHYYIATYENHNCFCFNVAGYNKWEEAFAFSIIDDNTMLVRDALTGAKAFKMKRTR